MFNKTIPMQYAGQAFTFGLAHSCDSCLPLPIPSPLCAVLRSAMLSFDTSLQEYWPIQSLDEESPPPVWSTITGLDQIRASCVYFLIRLISVAMPHHVAVASSPYHCLSCMDSESDPRANTLSTAPPKRINPTHTRTSAQVEASLPRVCLMQL